LLNPKAPVLSFSNERQIVISPGMSRPSSKMRDGRTNAPAWIFSPVLPLKSDASSNVPTKTRAKTPRAKNIWVNLVAVSTGTPSGWASGAAGGACRP
jgi:hypothetical protein